MKLTFWNENNQLESTEVATSRGAWLSAAALGAVVVGAFSWVVYALFG